jgi:hypothetical protein
MPRPKGVDPAKMASIFKVLTKYPEGTWIRRLAKEAGVHPTTATKYVEGPLAPMVEISSLGSGEGRPLLKVVRLKPIVLQRLEEGLTFEQIMRLLQVIREARK